MIRARRIGTGVSQKSLAGEVGVTIQQIYNYEHGFNKLSASQLIGIAQALDCRVRDLLGDFDRSAGWPPVDIRLDLTGVSQLLAAYSEMPDRLRHTTLELLIALEKAQERKSRRSRRRIRSL
jgi:transcriptional regulator with XRE-family HTH domain